MKKLIKFFTRPFRRSRIIFKICKRANQVPLFDECNGKPYVLDLSFSSKRYNKYTGERLPFIRVDVLIHRIHMSRWHIPLYEVKRNGEIINV